ncbi:MAG TPA: YdcF family protein, partial [Geobacterales bacterium]|nr:YdcF family protein [Geobacterales bacterium]
MQAKFRNLSKKWSRRTWWRLFVGRVLLFLLLLTALVTGVLFVDFVYKTFSLRRGELPTEAIVVLAGGKGRIEEGLRLYCAGEVQHLFLIGVDPGVTREKLLRQRGVTNLNEDIVIEQASRNTLENALYARSLLEQRQIHSITLITSRYHMKRAILIFRNVLP